MNGNLNREMSDVELQAVAGGTWTCRFVTPDVLVCTRNKQVSQAAVS